MWNVAKPTGGEDFDEEMPEEGSFRKTKASLLGPPPPSMLSSSKGVEGEWILSFSNFAKIPFDVISLISSIILL